MAIKEYYLNLTSEEKREFSFKVCQLLDICLASFYRRLRLGFKQIEEKAVLENIINNEN